MNETEQRICGCIDAHAQQLIAFAEDIYSHAELGYTEHRTAGKVADWLQSCGLDVQTGLANTGVKASLGSAAPSVWSSCEATASPHAAAESRSCCCAARLMTSTPPSQRMRTWCPVSRIFCSAATRPADFCPSSFTSRAEPLTQPLRRKTASMRWMS